MRLIEPREFVGLSVVASETEELELGPEWSDVD